MATLGWPYSRTFFAEPPDRAAAAGELYALRRATEAERPDWRWLVGAARWRRCRSVKPHAAVALPVLGLYLLGRTFARREWRSMVAPALLWGAGMAAVLLPYVAVNLWVFGSPVGGIAAGRSATSPIHSSRDCMGRRSPGAGLLWYAAARGWRLAGWWPFFRRHRAEALSPWSACCCAPRLLQRTLRVGGGGCLGAALPADRAAVRAAVARRLAGGAARPPAARR
ncbi:MAG: hypothetical protein U0232_20200 [Thermomicrobiales bacterium]